MFQNDYIMRAIEEFVQAIARILRARREGRHADARAEIEAACRAATGLEIEAALLMGHDALRAVVQDPERRAMLARLLAEYGEVLSDGGAEAAPYLRAAFVIYDELQEKGELPDEGGHAEALAALIDRL